MDSSCALGQALSQGALLTREDLACRLFLVGLRTLSRDLAWLRTHDQRPLPLRSTVRGIGPVLTHRVQVVRLALEGGGFECVERFWRISAATELAS